MHHFVTEMCTNVHISVTKWCIVGYGTGTLWDLGNSSMIRSSTGKWSSTGKCSDNVFLIVYGSHLQWNYESASEGNLTWSITLLRETWMVPFSKRKIHFCILFMTKLFLSIYELHDFYSAWKKYIENTNFTIHVSVTAAWASEVIKGLFHSHLWLYICRYCTWYSDMDTIIIYFKYHKLQI